LNSDERPTTSNDPLDALLSEANWSEAKLDAHARLADAYRAARWRTMRLATRIRGAIALAATVIVVFGLARFIRVDRRGPVRGTFQPVAMEMCVPMVIRAPTPLENAIIQVQRQTPRKPVLAMAPPQQATHLKSPSRTLELSAIAGELSNPDLPIERRQVLLVQLLTDGSSDAVRVFLDSVAQGATRTVSLAALDGTNDPPIERLIAALRDPLIDRRIAAARALGYMDGPVLTARLIEMAEHNVSRREAMIALACSRGEAAQRYLQRAAQSGPMIGLARSVRVQFDFQ
jgi:hypothetical protein